jgi:hypothetical protein
MKGSLAVQEKKKGTILPASRFLQHAAVRSIADHTVQPEPVGAVIGSRFGQDFSQVAAHSESGAARSALTPSCPVTPTRCPFGGACHACPVRVQTKLAMNQPRDDWREQEADRVADQVTHAPGAQLQRRAAGQVGPTNVPPIVHEVLGSPGQPLDAATRAFMEPRFGRDFSSVRVHNDATAAESARAVNALAYTVGRDVVFGMGQYTPSTMRGRNLIAHELIHVTQQGSNTYPQVPAQIRLGTPNDGLECEAKIGANRVSSTPDVATRRIQLKTVPLLQRAEVDDNPAFCFPPGGTPLSDVSSTINSWVRAASSRAERDALHMTAAVYQELGTGTGVTKVEKQLADLPSSQVHRVEMSESRYSGTGIWPVDPLMKLVLHAAGKIFVSPVINLCGVCVGADKVGHFFQQGYEYFRLAHALRARVEQLSREEQRRMYERLTRPLESEVEQVLPGGQPSLGFELSDYSQLIIDAFAHEFGNWLEGFRHRLSPEDIRWIKSQSFIPWYYSEGVYGAGSTGVLSRADLQANQQGFMFYEDLWTNPGQVPNICQYVGELWNERRNPSSYTEYFGTPRGPISQSQLSERP